MRLGSCIALECAAGATIAALLSAGVWIGVREAQARLGDPAERDRGQTIADGQSITAAKPEPVELPPPPVLLAGVGRFQGIADAELVAPLRSGTITHVTFNRGGSSISLRVDFDNGARAAFKPEQTQRQTMPRKEIAAYRLNRLLGMESVAPAVPRQFLAEDLIDSMAASSRSFIPRMRAEMIVEDGFVNGELSWWIPVIQRAQIDGFLLDETNGIVSWKRYLTIGNDIPEHDRELMAQVSDMVVFDFLINNVDRWSGRNTHMSEDGRILYFMDNTLSFGTSRRGHRKVRIYLERSQKFSRSLVNRLSDLTERSVREALDHDRGAFTALLTDAEITAVLSRRAEILEYVDELIAVHGVEEVLAFP